MIGEFSVFQFFEDGMSEQVRSHVDAKSAVDAAHQYCHSVGAKIGTTARVIITDGGDYTTFEWQFGKGVVFPPHDGKQFVAGGAA